jgi:AGZA family xanthine/uracil permease-like MFS transporter
MKASRDPVQKEPLTSGSNSCAMLTAPALIAVGMLMLGSVTRIDFADLTEVVPAFATITMILFTYSIANGLTAGLIVYPIIQLAAGRYRDLNAGSVALAVL